MEQSLVCIGSTQSEQREENSISKVTCEQTCTESDRLQSETAGILVQERHTAVEDKFNGTAVQNLKVEASLSMSSSCECDDSFTCSDVECDSDLDLWDTSQLHDFLPNQYSYQNMRCNKHNKSESFDAEFKVNISSDNEVKAWVKEYNLKTKETMVFGRIKVQKGKLVCTKFFLHCHYKQRQTEKHQKITKFGKMLVKNTELSILIIVQLK